MKENHSFDNYFGLLGRGDGFTLDTAGEPTNSNPDRDGNSVRVHHLSSPWQPWHGLDQHWNASHQQYNNGANDGFVRTTGSAVPMGYWTEQDLPFYYALARTFPIGDRYFASVLAQTFPNRRFLQAGTARGLVATTLPNPLEPNPPAGTIWNQLERHQLSWNNYFLALPEIGLYPRVLLEHPGHAKSIEHFYDDCRSGQLPAVSLVTPDLFIASEGETQDIQLGEAFTASIVDAVLHSPAWASTMLIITYDEGGGYYDHVPPPPAVPPDDIPPHIQVPPDQPGGYDRLGFRVPCIVVAPFAKADHVSHLVYDHTSILKTIQRKWNLPCLTHRDAAANDLLDFLDLTSPPCSSPHQNCPNPPCTTPDPETDAAPVGRPRQPPGSPPTVAIGLACHYEWSTRRACKTGGKSQTRPADHASDSPTKRFRCGPPRTAIGSAVVGRSPRSRTGSPTCAFNAGAQGSRCGDWA